MRADADFFCQPVEEIQVGKDEVCCNFGYKIFIFLLSLFIIPDFHYVTIEFVHCKNIHFFLYCYGICNLALYKPFCLFVQFLLFIISSKDASASAL